MKCVIDEKRAEWMSDNQYFYIMHRFDDTLNFIREYRHINTLSISVGVQESDYRLIDTIANDQLMSDKDYITIDIAHGHSLLIKKMIRFIKDKLPKVNLIAGNVATPEAYDELVEWGADAVKVGIGPGNVCTTKNVTGVTVPQFSAVKECANVVRGMNGRKPVIVADGGITEIGDIAKALGAGADLVMCGRLFAGCREAPGERVGGKKVYRGMASRDAMLTIRNVSSLPTAEGISTLIDASEHSAIDVVNQIKGGLQSSYSSSNARNLCEFQINAKFGIPHTQMK